MTFNKELMREMSQYEFKNIGTQNKYDFETLTHSKQVFVGPVFELPRPKNLKPESVCIELINLHFHITKLRHHILETVHVTTLDTGDFYPLSAPFAWDEMCRCFKRSNENLRELNLKIKVELIQSIDEITTELEKIIESNKKSLDEKEFPFLKLSPVEQAIIGYMVTPNTTDRSIVTGKDYYSRKMEGRAVTHIIAKMIDTYSEIEIRRALEPDASLISEDFLLVEVRDLAENSWDRVDLKLNYSKLFPHDKNGLFFNPMHLQEISSPQINLSDLELSPDLKEQIVGIINLYKKGKVSPLSFLFFGESGSGKTSLVHAIAKELGLDVVIVRDYNASERHLPSTIHFLMRKYKNKKVLILFDECENLWYENSYIFERDKSRSKEKNWSKHLLENPSGIVAFTSNFSPPAAFLRRVTLAAELAVPNVEVRAKILVEKSKELCLKLNINCVVTIEDFKSLSQTYELTGAFLERAVTLSLVYSEYELNRNSLEKALKSISATNGKKESENSLTDNGLVFNQKQTQIIEAIKNILERKKINEQDPLLPKSTSLMLYGPPGTGKTEFAKALSNKLGLKLKSTTASHFLSKYVGESEKTIAEIFKHAAKNKEILFIDEVEGLFMGRESAQRSWELTQIGEFLKQIESFEGVLVVATNHKEMIDQAFSRRFIFHVDFDYPEYPERLALLKRFIGEKLSNSELIELATELKFSPGELRNATALWSVFDLQSGRDLGLKIQEQINVRHVQKSKVIGLGNSN